MTYQAVQLETVGTVTVGNRSDVRGHVSGRPLLHSGSSFSVSLSVYIYFFFFFVIASSHLQFLLQLCHSPLQHPPILTSNKWRDQELFDWKAERFVLSEELEHTTVKQLKPRQERVASFTFLSSSSRAEQSLKRSCLCGREHTDIRGLINTVTQEAPSHHDQHYYYILS